MRPAVVQARGRPHRRAHAVAGHSIGGLGRILEARFVPGHIHWDPSTCAASDSTSCARHPQAATQHSAIGSAVARFSSLHLSVFGVWSGHWLPKSRAVAPAGSRLFLYHLCMHVIIACMAITCMALALWWQGGCRCRHVPHVHVQRTVPWLLVCTCNLLRHDEMTFFIAYSGHTGRHEPTAGHAQNSQTRLGACARASECC